MLFRLEFIYLLYFVKLHLHPPSISVILSKKIIWKYFWGVLYSIKFNEIK